MLVPPRTRPNFLIYPQLYATASDGRVIGVVQQASALQMHFREPPRWGEPDRWSLIITEPRRPLRRPAHYVQVGEHLAPVRQSTNNYSPGIGEMSHAGAPSAAIAGFRLISIRYVIPVMAHLNERLSSGLFVVLDFVAFAEKRQFIMPKRFSCIIWIPP